MKMNNKMHTVNHLILLTKSDLLIQQRQSPSSYTDQIDCVYTSRLQREKNLIDLSLIPFPYKSAKVMLLDYPLIDLYKILLKLLCTLWSKHVKITVAKKMSESGTNLACVHTAFSQGCAVIFIPKYIIFFFVFNVKITATTPGRNWCTILNESIIMSPP